VARHRFPPADVRVQRAAQVVLVDLLLLGPQSQHGPAGRQDRQPGDSFALLGSMAGRSNVQVNGRCQIGDAIVRAALICFFAG
jgi:hypothetical protein